MSTPSLVMIPAGRKATKLYSVLPTDGTGDFTVARAGLRNEINSDLKLELIAANVPAFNYDAIGGCPVLNTEPQATNLITYPISFGNSYWTKSGATIQGDASTAGSENITNGNFATDSDWTKETGWTISGGNLVGTSVTTGLAYQSSVVEANKMYKATFDAVVTSGSISLYFDGATGYQGITTTTQTVTVFFTAAATSPLYFRSNTSAFTGSIDNVSVKEVQGYSAPSVDFPTSAFKLVESTSASEKLIQRILSVTTSTIYTASVFVKYAGREWIRFTDAQSSNRIHFNTLTGAFGAITGTVIDYNSIAFSNGWYKLSITTTSVATAYALRVSLAEADNDVSYTGNGTSGVYIFMAQLETGSVATSPTFTDVTLASEGSTTTRLADSVNGAGDVNTFNDSEGVLMAEISALADDLSYRILSISNSTASERIYLQYTNVSNTVAVVVKNGNVTQANIAYVLDNETEFNKVLFKYKQNDFALWVNGFKVGTDASGTTPTGLSELAFDGGDGNNDFYGNTKQIQYFNSALADSELETLTSWMSFSDMAIDLNYTIQ